MFKSPTFADTLNLNKSFRVWPPKEWCDIWFAALRQEYIFSFIYGLDGAAVGMDLVAEASGKKTAGSNFTSQVQIRLLSVISLHSRFSSFCQNWWQVWSIFNSSVMVCKFIFVIGMSGERDLFKVSGLSLDADACASVSNPGQGPVRGKRKVMTYI